MPYHYDPVLTPVGRERQAQQHQQQQHQQYHHHQQQQQPHHAPHLHPNAPHQAHPFDLGSLYSSSGNPTGPSSTAGGAGGAGASGGAGGSGGDVSSAFWGHFHLAGSHTDSSTSSPEVGGLLPSAAANQQRHRWDSPNTLAGPSGAPVPPPHQQQAQPAGWYPGAEYRAVDVAPQWRYDDKARERYPYSPTSTRSHVSPAAHFTPRHHPYEPEFRSIPVPGQTQAQDDVRPAHPPKSGRLGVKRRQKYTRSRTGCLGCRARRIKCDEGRPVCRRCQVAKRECVFPEEVEKRGEKNKHHDEDDEDDEHRHQDPRQFDLTQSITDLPPNWGLGEAFPSNFLPDPSAGTNQHHQHPHSHRQHSLDVFHLNAGELNGSSRHRYASGDSSSNSEQEQRDTQQEQQQSPAMRRWTDILSQVALGAH